MIIDPFEKRTSENRLGFIALGFTDPETLDYLGKNFTSTDSLQAKLDQLKDRDVPDPIKAIIRHPPLASRDVPRAFQILEKNGIANIGKNVQKFPQLADVDIVRVLADWKAAGVDCAAAAISAFPSMAGRNAQAFVDGLKKAGLKNPSLTIERFPPITGLSQERVAKRVQFMIDVCKASGMTYDAVSFLEDYPSLFGYNIHRILFYLRIAKHFELEPKHFYALLKKNPYLILHVISREALLQAPDLMKRAHAITRLDKNGRDEIINAAKEHLPETLETLKEQVESEKTNQSKTDEERKHTVLCLSLARSLMRQLVIEQKVRESRTRPSTSERATSFRIIEQKKKPKYVEKTIPIPFDENKNQ